jgi:hypothetical protein
MDNEASQKSDELSDDDDEEEPVNVLVNSINEKAAVPSNKSVLKLSITFSHWNTSNVLNKTSPNYPPQMFLITTKITNNK